MQLTGYQSKSLDACNSCYLLDLLSSVECGQHKVGGHLLLLCQIDSDVVQCKYQDLCTDSYSQANKPIMPTIHIEFELKTLKVCTHEKITRTEGDTLPLHV